MPFSCAPLTVVVMLVVSVITTAAPQHITQQAQHAPRPQQPPQHHSSAGQQQNGAGTANAFLQGFQHGSQGGLRVVPQQPSIEILPNGQTVIQPISVEFGFGGQAGPQPLSFEILPDGRRVVQPISIEVFQPGFGGQTRQQHIPVQGQQGNIPVYPGAPTQVNPSFQTQANQPGFNTQPQSQSQPAFQAHPGFQQLPQNVYPGAPTPHFFPNNGGTTNIDVRAGGNQEKVNQNGKH